MTILPFEGMEELSIELASRPMNTSGSSYQKRSMYCPAVYAQARVRRSASQPLQARPTMRGIR